MVASWTQEGDADDSAFVEMAVGQLAAMARKQNLRLVGPPRFAWLRVPGVAAVLVAVSPVVSVRPPPAAPCVEAPSRWFPADSARGFEARCAPAVAICESVCPAPTRAQCLADVMRAEAGTGITERKGVFAGLLPRQRLELDRQWNVGLYSEDQTARSVV